MSRKKHLRRKHDKPRELQADEWPIGEGVQIMIDLSGEPHSDLYEECPICRALREHGVPVVTIDASDELDSLDLTHSRGGSLPS